MDPEKTALVLIEYQNDFTSEGARCTRRLNR
jgi:nicotinamidase-related amidase